MELYLTRYKRAMEQDMPKYLVFAHAMEVLQIYREMGLEEKASEFEQELLPKQVKSEERTLVDSMNEILELYENAENLQELIKQVENKRIVPFIGAGLSVPMGYPRWSDFLLGLVKQDEGVRVKVQAFLNKNDYENAASEIVNYFGEDYFNRLLKQTFGKNSLKGKTLQGAVTLLPKLTQGPLITTNYDHVLETVYHEAGVLLTVGWGARVNLSVDALNTKSHFLFKVHGDAEDSTEQILTKAQYRQHYGTDDANALNPDSPLVKMLNIIFTQGSLLFLGCSLQQDRTLNVLQSAQNVPWHYAIVELPKENIHKRRRFLTDKHILPIWYRYGHHEDVETLLKYIVNKELQDGTDGTTVEEKVLQVEENQERPEDLRNRMTNGLTRSELSEIWYDILNTTMEDFVPQQGTSACVIALLDRIDKRAKLGDTSLQDKLLRILRSSYPHIISTN